MWKHHSSAIRLAFSDRAQCGKAFNMQVSTHGVAIVFSQVTVVYYF